MLERSDSLDQLLYKYAIDTDSCPSQQQITETIKTIGSKFPHLDSFTIVETLYNKLHELRQSFPTFHILQSRHFDYHQVLKRKIAKIFYHKGYGYQKFKLYLLHSNLSFKIDLKTYSIFCEGIVLQLYRNLQKMMIRNGVAIKFKHRAKVRELNQWVLNYSMFLQERDSQLLRVFFAKCYELTDVDFAFKEGKELYELLEKRFDVLEDMVMMEECLKDIDLDLNDNAEEQQPLLKLQEHLYATQCIDLNIEQS